MMPAVTWTRHDGWADVVLNRPERRNAIEGTLAADLGEALRTVNADAEVRAIVLRGAGSAFCSGLDLKAFAAEPAPAWKAGFAQAWDDVHGLLLESPKVLVVALERYAINGGAALALAGDVLIAGETAYLQVGEIQIGMAAPRNLAWLVLRHSEAVAARLALLGERVAAPELLRLGVATEVVPDADVVTRAHALAAQIGAYPAAGVAAVKTALRAARAQMPPRDWLGACAQARPAGTDLPLAPPPRL
ncbi:enoyl-CoA hydratase/isomerase family protein [Achromobacter sp. GG226]|uniref:enoyl-CoA hydratase/isomerase family protein n=1 Tax=Verticiella alkaliphila TaxID=2779529 RepID=UPI001C0E6DD4|nr:enoyl-CoA hydratase/isomerase family protein [Verticiella sp. GG226]MBU4609417.1 enoyl-CoA hydratase/isomerase family protein [Verticiella sp. GG226]